MPRKTLPHVKIKTAKGRTYVYFDTGQLKPNGQPVLVRLPPLGDIDFGRAYAAQLGIRTKRADAPNRLTVPQLVRMYRKSPDYAKLSEGTHKIYSIYLDRLCELLPTAPAAELAAQDVRGLMDNMADTPGAANMVLAVIASTYKWARSRQHVANFPTLEVVAFDLGEHEPWPEELLSLALVADRVRVKLVTHLLYYTAQRIGDVLKMRWSDVHGDRIKITAQKTGRKMDIPLHVDLRRLLDATPRAGMRIVTRGDGGPVSDKTIRDELQAFASERGYKIVPHGLRKNAVNALLEAGCSVAETAAISGQTLRLVEHYAKMRNQSKLASAAILKWENAAGTGKPLENGSNK